MEFRRVLFRSPGVTAATAISFMQERDDSLMTTVYHSVEDGWEKIAKQTLSNVVQFWDTERSVSVTGVDGSFDAIVLQGSELEKGTDIRKIGRASCRERVCQSV